MFDRLSDARDTVHAASVLERAIAERLSARSARPARGHLALEAAPLLRDASVSAVAGSLGVSERHLRRVFHETVGVSPKVFARLQRFRRAIRAARKTRADWADVAADAGYYDQAHLIAEFRAISGVTPRALLEELAAATPIG